MSASAFDTNQISSPATDERRSRRALNGWGFAEIFVISQTVLPALLYLPGTQGLRVPIRVSAFAISFAALGAWFLQGGQRAGRPHPSRPWLLAAIGWLAIQIFHPTTNSTQVGIAQTLLYLAVLAPVFWAPNFVASKQKLERVLWLFLICNGINSVVGILQVYDPARWMPREFSKVITDSAQGVLTYRDAFGRDIVRPPGLSDNPGAVCGPAMVATILGLIFCLAKVPAWKRVLAIGFAFCGLGAIYASQVRTGVVILAASVAAYVIILQIQRQRAKAYAFLGLSAAIFVSAFLFAVFFLGGGGAIVARFASLTDDDPAEVYVKSGRANMLHNAYLTALDYPLGAGLGRQGMTRSYFGDLNNKDSGFIWSEIQFSAWILDGGIILAALYLIALGKNAWSEWSLARAPGDNEFRALAAAVFSVNLGTLALLFGFIPFTAPLGLQYWFLAAALHGAAQEAMNFNGLDVRHSFGGFRDGRRDGTRQL